MNNRVVTMTMLVIASLLASPVVVADDTQDIPTNAQNTGAHDSLVALSHAGLVSALQADGPFTVFAPTDDAFAVQESISPHSTPTRRTLPSATYCCIT